MGLRADYVWHGATSLAGFDGVFIPGGFTYGDYLRCGAIASLSPIMEAVREFAAAGGPVIGACNGFQVLCEAGLLPGALMRNASQKFICDRVRLRAENRTSLWTRNVTHPIVIPIAHGQGRYVCDPETLRRLRAEDRIAFRYIGPEGNPNGSVDDIAGVLNEHGNVLGMMPHPERATKAILGGEDGRLILEGFQAAMAQR